ncbi:hypothetical protein MACH26_07020 [Planctobacterium marinum]|uniref:Uncharacterized protein n=1 Tax=Planctobacterium marinum TaxID=1631968 RepID=A0AA48HF19_9ALTE|nr:hypothetical protein MACH26_07020 [Planctobacterium marinum]
MLHISILLALFNTVIFVRPLFEPVGDYLMVIIVAISFLVGRKAHNIADFAPAMAWLNVPLVLLMTGLLLLQIAYHPALRYGFNKPVTALVTLLVIILLVLIAVFAPGRIKPSHKTPEN